MAKVLSRGCSFILVTLLLSGCAYRYQFVTGKPPSGTRVQENRHIAIWGYVEAAPFDLERSCPNGVSEFGSYVSFLNWLSAFLTIGIYTPRTVYAVCSQS
jgi:hypothetical protein